MTAPALQREEKTAPRAERPGSGGPRRWRIAVAITAVGLATVAGGLALRGPGHRHLTLAATAAGLPLVHSGKPLQAEVATDLVLEFQRQKLRNIVGGVYARRSGPTEGVVIVGSDAGAFQDPVRQVQQYADSQVSAAAKNGFPVPAAGRALPVAAGPRGGNQACATMSLASQGIPFAVCAWVDGDTNGFALSNDQSPADLGTTLADARTDMER